MFFHLYSEKKKARFVISDQWPRGLPCGQCWLLHENKYKHYLRLYLTVLLYIGEFNDIIYLCR